MKLKQTFLIAMACCLAGSLHGQVTETFNSTDTPIDVPDATNSAGVSSFLTVSGFSGTPDHVSVTLDLAGNSTAWNGDYYIIISGPNTNAFAVLMNRVGRGTGATNSVSYSFGYGDNGFDLTFSDTATNDIHYYQALGFSTNSSGQVTGTSWAADGRELDPQTNDPSVYADTPQTATMSSLVGYDPNGQWTLYLVDVSSGDQGTLVNWSLQLSTVPEPTVAALSIFGGMAFLVFFRGREK